MLEDTQAYTSKFTTPEDSKLFQSEEEEEIDHAAFGDRYPFFKAGVTPAASVRTEMDSEDQERRHQLKAMQARKGIGAVRRQGDFDEVRARKTKFRNLMETTYTIPGDESEIQSNESVASRVSQFPFQKLGQGLSVTRYEQAILEAKLREEEEKKR